MTKVGLKITPDRGPLLRLKSRKNIKIYNSTSVSFCLLRLIGIFLVSRLPLLFVYKAWLLAGKLDIFFIHALKNPAEDEQRLA